MKKSVLLLSLLLSIFMLSSCSEEFNGEKVDAIIQSINENGLNEKDLNDLLVQYEACTELKRKTQKRVIESESGADKGAIQDLNYLSSYWARMTNLLCYKTLVERDYPEIYKKAEVIRKKSAII